MECDGTDTGIVTARQCEVEMDTFLNSPFSLLEGDLIVVIVEALNVIDYSVPSDPNTSGELAQVKPHTPTTKPRRGALTDELNI